MYSQETRLGIQGSYLYWNVNFSELQAVTLDMICISHHQPKKKKLVFDTTLLQRLLQYRTIVWDSDV